MKEKFKFLNPHCCKTNSKTCQTNLQDDIQTFFCIVCPTHAFYRLMLNYFNMKNLLPSPKAVPIYASHWYWLYYLKMIWDEHHYGILGNSNGRVFNTIHPLLTSINFQIHANSTSGFQAVVSDRGTLMTKCFHSQLCSMPLDRYSPCSRGCEALCSCSLRTQWHFIGHMFNGTKN